MLPFSQAIAIAVLSGVISAFATNLFKAYFDRRARGEEWQRTQDRWILDKSARSAEEIVTVLEEVSKSLARGIGEVSHEVDLLGQDARVPHDYEEKVIDPALSRINQSQGKHRIWFSYEIRRVSAWFTDDMKVYGELEDLGKQVDAVYEELYISLANVAMRRNQRPSLSNEDYQKSLRGEIENFGTIFPRYHAVDTAIAEYQQEVVKRLRDPKSGDDDLSRAGQPEDKAPTKTPQWLERTRRRLAALQRSSVTGEGQGDSQPGIIVQAATLLERLLRGG